ncbi:hypothetical protein [Sulfuriferula sp.]|uniref:hypothetical protein n=1 Tax=Sulfuriferula sp. TaxID=2025307 RepID=UPI00272EEABD|nr:hypothetical protein [Sulfuriferula sp.]MDP2026870.1 hypothetical protein [Sulfuriferula sp.]
MRIHFDNGVQDKPFQPLPNQEILKMSPQLNYTAVRFKQMDKRIARGAACFARSLVVSQQRMQCCNLEQNNFNVVKPLFLALALIAVVPAQAARKSCPAPLNFKLTTLQGQYLISRNGKTVQSFDSAVTPEDPAFLSSVERLLNEKAN